MGDVDAVMFLLVAKSRSLASYPPNEVDVRAVLWSTDTLKS